MNPQNLGRVLRTLRHLHGAQVAWRLRYGLRRTLRRVPRLPAPPPTLAFHAATTAALHAHLRLCQATLPPPPGQTEGWRAGEFRFLGETLVSPAAPPWEASTTQSRLWRYHLHYFSFARDLAVENADITWDEDRVLLRRWMHSWIDAHPVGADVAWDAFTVSERLINWCMAAAVFQLNDTPIMESMHQQSEWLLRSLEHDIRANHLLKNAVALTVAGAMLDHPAAATGQALLKREAREQILGDGGHYELSPMYHIHVLSDLLLVRAVIAAKADWLNSAILRAAGWLEAVCHPDGEIPLFGDAALDAAPAPRGILDLAARAMDRPPQRTADRGGASYALADSGYHVLSREDRRGWMIVKASGVSPAYQPGHAHCDVLSFEFSARRTRLLVDSGVHGYAGSPHRVYCRSTAAHNTAQIGSGEQHECWSTFRVGRRARVTLHDWDGRTLEASHDGFAPAVHRRRVAFDGVDSWRVQDSVQGHRGATWRSFIHVHPEAEITPMDSGEAYRIHRGDAAILLRLDPGTIGRLRTSEESPAPAYYCPRFGEARPAPIFELTAAGGADVLAYAIVLDDSKP